MLLFLNVSILIFHDDFTFTAFAESDSSSPSDFEIGQVGWLEANYPPNGTGIVRVIDRDLNLDPETADILDIHVRSDSHAGGVYLTLTETDKSTGIFEGTVFFAMFHSTSTTLRVAEGDTITAEYEDNTLPDPYGTADKLDIAATTYAGFSPYDPCNDDVHYNDRGCRHSTTLRIVDAFGNTLNTVYVDQQMQLTTDVLNGQYEEQSFTCLVQIKDDDGVVVYLKWITGSLSPGQTFSPSLSWIPTEAGTFTATAFVWESIENANPLSPSISTTIEITSGGDSEE